MSGVLSAFLEHVDHVGDAVIHWSNSQMTAHATKVRPAKSARAIICFFCNNFDLLLSHINFACQHDC